jgi:hypothetical protein
MSASRAAIVAALIAVLGGGLGGLIQSKSQSHDAQKRDQLNTQAALGLLQKQTEDTRREGDLGDLRRVLDATATHLALATRSMDTLHDRCYTAVHEGVAVPGRIRQTSSAAYRRWQHDLLQSYLRRDEVRVDRERLRIRLRQPQLLKLYSRVEDDLSSAQAPCASAYLAPNAYSRLETHLTVARRDTTAYFSEVVRSAGTQLPPSTP